LVACARAATYGQACDDTSNPCSDTNTYCGVGKQCVCMLGYSPVGLNCVRQKKNIDDACTVSEECTAAFAICKDLKCACNTEAGFAVANPATTPASCTATPLAQCPGGDFKKGDGDKPLACKIFGVPGATSRNKQPPHPDYYKSTIKHRKVGTRELAQMDTCTTGAYCSPWFQTAYTPAATMSSPLDGFCCPFPKAKCPVGKAIDDAATDCSNCPDSAYCYYDPGVYREVCCPRACYGDDMFLLDSKGTGGCYAKSAMNAPCDRDEQCSDMGAKCVSVPALTGQGSGKGCACSGTTVNVNSMCVAATCTNGQQPFMFANGGIQRCGMTGTAACPKNYVCQASNNICCASSTSNPTNPSGPSSPPASPPASPPTMTSRCPTGWQSSLQACTASNQCMQGGQCPNKVCCYQAGGK